MDPLQPAVPKKGILEKLECTAFSLASMLGLILADFQQLRNRAFVVGVSHPLGKPDQEDSHLGHTGHPPRDERVS
jgi:hypothetical protein